MTKDERVELQFVESLRHIATCCNELCKRQPVKANPKLVLDLIERAKKEAN